MRLSVQQLPRRAGNLRLRMTLQPDKLRHSLLRANQVCPGVVCIMAVSLAVAPVDSLRELAVMDMEQKPV
jgi:hypothetical protein